MLRHFSAKTAILLLVGALLLPPAPPVATWTGPGELTVEYEGEALFYARPGSPPVFLPCDSPCLLRRGGDALYAPEAGGELWGQTKDGALSAVVRVPPEPKWFRVILPLIMK